MISVKDDWARVFPAGDGLEQRSSDPLERRAGEGGRPDERDPDPGGALTGLAEAQEQVDVATFTQWVDAYARNESELADFYFKRFRAEFEPAVKAWVATRPIKNPDAPLTPFAMSQYKLAAQAEADRLDAQAEVSAATVQRNIQRASNYVLAVVLFAVALFFAGISTRLSAVRLRAITVALGAVLFVGTVVWIATFPVSVSV